MRRDESRTSAGDSLLFSARASAATAAAFLRKESKLSPSTTPPELPFAVLLLLHRQRLHPRWHGLRLLAHRRRRLAHRRAGRKQQCRGKEKCSETSGWCWGQFTFFPQKARSRCNV